MVLAHRLLNLSTLVNAVGVVFDDVVYVMMNLDWINNQGVIQNQNQVVSNLNQLKSANVDGINVDVWWGIVENQPNKYNWSPYVPPLLSLVI